MPKILHDVYEFNTRSVIFAYSARAFFRLPCFDFLLKHWKKTRNSHQIYSIEKAVLKKTLQYWQENTLCWSLFLIKWQVWRLQTLLKKLQHSCFPFNIAKIFKHTYFEEFLRKTASTETIFALCQKVLTPNS